MRAGTTESQSPADIRISHKGPAYLQLAGLIKYKIAHGEYSPGSKIPAESVISRTYGVAVMTVRQAISLLAEQGLVKRVHGRGTFICGPDWTKACFNMVGLLDMLGDKNHIDIRILDAGIVAARPKAAAALQLAEGAPVINLVRLVSHRSRPILLNKAYLIFDPKSPIVESELEVSSLSGLFSGQDNSFIKKAMLKLEPCLLAASEAAYLKADVIDPAFKIRYTFYGYNDAPVGSGWFMTPMSIVTFSTKIGVWDEED
ncbi:MAG: GntR family transcriptional regulator [Candidatus Adiutrix sp.]|jgi:GntR family transcriptional regulator|nr:GntR family transcriptional regulator [Candidatus Adiutrix sp.]